MSEENDSLEINLFDIAKILWVKKTFILSTVLAFSILSIIYSLSLPNEYRSEAKLAFAQDATGMGMDAGGIGGLASMAGINISGEAKASESMVAVEIMSSWSFIEDFISINNLEVELFASTGWNEEDNSILIDKDKYDTVTNSWIDERPSSFKMYEEFIERLTVEPDYMNGLVYVSFDHFSPHYATSVLNKLIDNINQHMKDRKLLMTDKNLEYLRVQLKETNNVDMKRIFFALVQEQVKERMLTLATPDYALDFVYRPMVPEEKFKPVRSVMVILGSFLGFIFSSIYIIFVHLNKKSKV